MAAKHYMITALSFLIAKFTFGDVASTSYGITNGNITLKANIRGVLEEILWKWNDNKVVEVDQNSRDEYGRFTGRTVVNVTTGDLTITALTEGDSGNYHAEAQVAGKLQQSYHRVEIIGDVASTSYGITNGNITLKANIRGVLEEILWKWNDNKVVEVDKNSRDEYGRFTGRTVVNVTTGDLTITALTEGDSGNYHAEAQVAGKLQQSYHRVEIIDPVTEPIVTCETSGNTLTLVCAGDLSPLTEYSWEGPEGPMLLSGSELQLDSGESPDTVYTCVVKNPANERRGSITIHHCFTAGAVIIKLAIALGVLSVLLVVFIGIYIYCKKRYKGTERETNDLTEQEDTSNGGLLLAPPPEQQGVDEEQGVLGDEDRPGDEEDPSHSRQECPI